MRLTPLLAASLILAAPILAACEPQAPAAPETPPAPAPVLAGVDLGQPVRALGTEPFWSLEIAPDGLTFTGVDRPEARTANPGPVVQGAAAEWTARAADGAEWRVTLTGADCSDGMSDRTYPLTARLKIGDETLTGCAAATAAILAAGESGRVGEAPAP